MFITPSAALVSIMNFLRGMKRGFVSNFVDSSILETPDYTVVEEGVSFGSLLLKSVSIVIVNTTLQLYNR